MKKLTIVGLLLLPLLAALFVLATRVHALKTLWAFMFIFLPLIAVVPALLCIISVFREKRWFVRLAAGLMAVVSLLLAALLGYSRINAYPYGFVAPPASVQLRPSDNSPALALDVAVFRTTAGDGDKSYYLMLGRDGVLQALAKAGVRRNQYVQYPWPGQGYLVLRLPYDEMSRADGLKPASVRTEGMSVLIALENGDSGHIDLSGSDLRDQLVSALAAETKTEVDSSERYAMVNPVWLRPASHWTMKAQPGQRARSGSVWNITPRSSGQ